MNEKYEKAKELLKKYNQEQLLMCYDKLNEEHKERLLDQILKIDYEQIEKLYKQTKTKNDFTNYKIATLSYIDKKK